jgi:hypothetical protein
MRAAFAALALAVFAGGSTSAARYHVTLDERAPLHATVSVDLPLGRTGDLPLGIRPRSEPSLVGAPDCDGAPLATQAPRQWTALPSCRTIHWTLGLRDQDKEGMDASAPFGAWSAQARWWLLTDHLAFLAPPGGWDEADVEITAQLRDGRIVKRVLPFPRRGQMPFYGIVSAAPPRLYRSNGFTLRVHGAVPPEAGDAQQLFFTQTWSRWRRDVLPVSATSPAELDVLWIPPPPHGEPNFLASAGMRAVLMQNVPGPDRAASDAKLRAAVILGVHEGFHTLIGSIPATWPIWVNESWASYFAWRAAEPHLDPGAFKMAKELIDAPASPSLLAIQTQVEHGDGSNYEAFYGKGARFWAAIDAVLTTRRNPSGRLAALIQDTYGLKGLDWSSPAAIAAYLDARSAGRASPIVHCYLVATNCDVALPPIAKR